LAKLIIAEHLGFCFGVENAVTLAKKSTEQARCAGAPIYVCGSLIHNKTVARELENLGLITVKDISEVPFGAFVIVRSHGEGRAFFDEARRRNIQIIDATCPKVRAIQKIAEKAGEEGSELIIIGDPDHPEVKSIKGWYTPALSSCAQVAGSTALDIGPSGKLIDMPGGITFDEAYDLYKEIVTAGEKAGADLILLETFTDIVELKAAILAANLDRFTVVDPIFEAVRKEAEAEQNS
jgi:4-hydroxy-3-methylbut-2-enyl diphosphate reductase